MKASWTEVALGEVAALIRDVVEPSAIADGTLYVGLENIRRGGAFANVGRVARGELASAKFAFNSSHILYGKLRPYLGKVARPGFAGVCSTDILPIAPGLRIDRNYLAHFLSLPATVELAARRSTGANLPRLAPAELMRFRTPLPPLDEQRRIARVLDRAEQLQAQRRHSGAMLRALRASCFIKAFGDPRANPNGFPIGSIGDIVASADYGSSTKASAAGRYPILRMGNITVDGDVDMADLKFVDFDQRDLERYLVRNGDVLFNRTNSPDLVGKTAVYHGPAPVTYAGYLIRVRMRKGHSGEYLSGFLNSQYGKRHLRALAKAIIGMANINAGELRAIRLPIPPQDLQQRFATTVSAMRAHESRIEAHRNRLATLFASLQERAFTGQL